MKAAAHFGELLREHHTEFLFSVHWLTIGCDAVDDDPVGADVIGKYKTQVRFVAASNPDAWTPEHIGTDIWNSRAF